MLGLPIAGSTAAKVIGGTAIFGLVATFWSKLLMIMGKIKSIFIVGFTVSLDVTDKNAVIHYLRTNYKCLGARKWSFTAMSQYRRTRQRYVLSPFQEFMPNNDFVMFARKWSFLFLSMSDNNRDTTPYTKITIWTFRGLLKPKDFFAKAIYDYDNLIHNHKKEKKNRFYLHYESGIRGTKYKNNDESDAIATPQVGRDQLTMHAQYIPLGFDWSDVVQDGTSEKELYSLSDSLRVAFEEARFWIESKNWYYDRGIPWRRGWLMIGSPGVGKTAFVRWMARKLDLPITTYDLATFSNTDFTSSWRRLSNRSPCIALIEDIDAIYEHRRNKTDTEHDKGLTFDCFLNCLDGIQRNDGIFTIITSNKPDLLDSAIGIQNSDGSSSRPGRIDRIVEVNPLNLDQKREIALMIFKDFEDMVPEIIKETNEESGACFVERCRIIAEKALWQKIEDESETEVPVTFVN